MVIKNKQLRLTWGKQYIPLKDKNDREVIDKIQMLRIQTQNYIIDRQNNTSNRSLRGIKKYQSAIGRHDPRKYRKTYVNCNKFLNHCSIHLDL